MPGLSHSKCSINSCGNRKRRERKRKEEKKHGKEGGRGEKNYKGRKKVKYSMDRHKSLMTSRMGCQ